MDKKLMELADTLLNVSDMEGQEDFTELGDWFYGHGSEVVAGVAFDLKRIVKELSKK